MTQLNVMRTAVQTVKCVGYRVGMLKKKKKRTKTKHSRLTTMAKCDSEGSILSFEGAEDNHTSATSVHGV